MFYLSFLGTFLLYNFFKVENAFFINKDQLYPLTWWQRTHFLWDYWDIMARHNGRFPIFATMKKKIIPSLSYKEKGVNFPKMAFFFSFAEFLFFIIFFFVKGRNKIVYNSRKNRSINLIWLLILIWIQKYKISKFTIVQWYHFGELS